MASSKCGRDGASATPTIPGFDRVGIRIDVPLTDRADGDWDGDIDDE